MLFLLPTLFSLLLCTTVVNAEQPPPDVLFSRSLGKRTWGPRKTYNVSFYHINDVHAHIDQFRSSGSSCTDPTKGCVGGYSRVKTIIDKTRPTHHNSLFLNAGDEFQGTLFYSFYKGSATAQVLNQMGFDAMTLGNHEFDDGDQHLAEFVHNLTIPVLSCNVHSANEKLQKKLIPYKLYPKHSLALVAVTTDTTPSISSPDNGTTFDEPIQAVQKTVDLIRKRYPYIKRIVALTHIGYDQDILLAKQTRGVNLIIGGHSHTLLGSMAGAAGPYPTIEKNLDGQEVFIVTSYRWGEYLGYIDIEYEQNSGKILGYTGAPIHLTNDTVQNPQLQKEIDTFAEGFAHFATTIIGNTTKTLVQSTCQQQECTLGDFIADAILAYRESNGAVIGITNSGGIRTEIEVGNITLQTSLETFPFGNTVVDLTFTGAELWKIVESAISRVSQFNGRAVTSAVQWSHTLRVQYNPSNPAGSKIISITVNGEKLVADKQYHVAAIDFLAGGGDNVWEASMGGSWVPLKSLDEVFADQVTKLSPLSIEVDGRLSVTDQTTPELKF
ncbi:5'-nucleotidase [Pluteus cervinus]|uniref:5'-nucleotidase n=1 Tax=Pluteus cervinus TaxID=181527 RepID=A0ACD3AYY1_9AGAR|nr:5'-nucleotidase [Pluteus cervinus]